MSERKPMTQSRLANYIPLRQEFDSKRDRLERLRSEERLPPMRQGDGSKRTPGRGDRMERAIIRRMEYEKRELDRLDEIIDEMEAIEDAIESLIDPLEKDVLSYRYMTGSYYRKMKWREVALHVYGDDDEKHLRAVFRIHDRALANLQEVET